MAKEKQAAKQYDSIIDAFLDDREPDWKELDLADAQKSGDEQLDRTHQYVDKDFMDEIAESASRHTPVWGEKAGTHTYEERIAEKEAAAPRVNAVKADWRKDARRDNEAYNTEMGDNDQLMNEVCMTLDQAGREGDLKPNSADKKSISDEKVFKYVRDLLNQGVSPTKVAQKLEKLAELELFNHQSATDYLQRNAGLMGLAYLEPNTYMDKNSPTYERTASKTAEDPDWNPGETDEERAKRLEAQRQKDAREYTRRNGSNQCEAQKKAWDKAGIKPQAKSVKQISACEGCQYFNKDARSKNCNLYHLPLIASTEELTQIVNNLTPGVPKNQKHAALVQIANGEGTRAQAATSILAQTQVVKTADAKVRNQAKRASYEFKDEREVSKKFSSEHVAKMHFQGASLKRIYEWAEPKFGSIDVSFAFRGFVQSLKKDGAGKVVVASADLSFLNSIGIRGEQYQGAAKCASCPDHFNRTTISKQASESTDWDAVSAPRVDAKFSQRTPDAIRNSKTASAEVVVTPKKIRTLHQAGHSIEKIYNGAASKVGSVQAKKAVAGYVEDFKKNPGKVAFAEADRAFLVGKLGFKPEAVRILDPARRPVTQVVASVPDGQNILSYPGMEKHAGEKKITDGHSILAEYDLQGAHDMQDIDTSGHKLEDIELNSTFRLEE
jgi:hypothetical protein